MEELKRLERTQGILGLMRDHAARTTPPHPDYDRFLADLILLLVKPRKGLSLERKRALLSEFLPKISGSLLEEAERLVVDEDCAGEEEEVDWEFGCCSSGPVVDGTGDTNNERDRRMTLRESNDEAMVGLQAMQRANSTLEDFCRSYFMFHGMDVSKPESVFKVLPLLAFTEAYIYQLDDMNERLIMENIQSPGKIVRVISEFKTVPLRPLLRQLELHGLINDRLQEELKSGEEYWALERKLCLALETKTEVQVEDIMRAIHLKSFDYRVLNLLLYQIRGAEVNLLRTMCTEDFRNLRRSVATILTIIFTHTPSAIFRKCSFRSLECPVFFLKVNSLHMDFLSVSEFLVEIADDLFDYEDDVLKNSFNILRMFAHVYGASVASTMLAKCIAEAEEKYNTLLKALGPELSAAYQRRCEDATREGGNAGGHPLGTWNIPQVIVNEEAYRLMFGSQHY